MTQQQIISRLNIAFGCAEIAITDVPDTILFKQPEVHKWSIAEHADHLFHSVKPLAGLFGKPSVMEENWGCCHRVGLSYDELVAGYEVKAGSVRGNTFVSGPDDMPRTKAVVLEKLHDIQAKLLVRASLFTDAELDRYQAPHPLLGLLTCREFLYFTHHHTLVHTRSINHIKSLLSGT